MAFTRFLAPGFGVAIFFLHAGLSEKMNTSGQYSSTKDSAWRDTSVPFLPLIKLISKYAICLKTKTFFFLLSQRKTSTQQSEYSRTDNIKWEQYLCHLFFSFSVFSAQFNRRVWTEFHVSWPCTWPRICYVLFDYFSALYNALVSESRFVVAMKLWRIPIVLSYF